MTKKRNESFSLSLSLGFCLFSCFFGIGIRYLFKFGMSQIVDRRYSVFRYFRFCLSLLLPLPLLLLLFERVLVYLCNHNIWIDVSELLFLVYILFMLFELSTNLFPYILLLCSTALHSRNPNTNPNSNQNPILIKKWNYMEWF